jgi:hypothetical protein
LQTTIKVRAPDGWTCVVAQDGDVFLPVQWRDVWDCVRKSHVASPALREHPFARLKQRWMPRSTTVERDYLRRFSESIVERRADDATEFERRSRARFSPGTRDVNVLDGNSADRR